MDLDEDGFREETKGPGKWYMTLSSLLALISNFVDVVFILNLDKICYIQ